jgi:hypothetical protein
MHLRALITTRTPDEALALGRALVEARLAGQQALPRRAA